MIKCIVLNSSERDVTNAYIEICSSDVWTFKTEAVKRIDQKGKHMKRLNFEL